jgi:hypothetical protein
VVRFEVAREWFAAAGCGGGAVLRVRIGAQGYATEGCERLGFRYNIERNPPMQVLEARWLEWSGVSYTTRGAQGRRAQPRRR